MTNESSIYQILETAPIESLGVEGQKREALMDEYSEEMVANPLLQLQSLQRFSVTRLWANAISLRTLFQAHQNRLTSVTITDCSVRRPDYPKFWTNKIRQDWLLILLELQKMAHLHSLHLEKLQSTNTMDETTPLEGDQCLDVDMAIKAIWRSVEEIQIGLQNILENYCVLAHPFSLDTGPFPPWKSYLNLRYANLKVSPRYRLSEAEIKALKALRAERRGVSPDGLLPAIFEVMDGKGSLGDLEHQPALHSQER